MKRQFSAELTQLADDLKIEAGSYLVNAIREPSVTCRVCSTPVDGYELCVPCRGHIASTLPLADRVGSMIYAVEPDSQAYRLVYNYKTAGAGPSHRRIMNTLLAVGLRGHVICAQRLAGAQSSGWAVVPSTQGRTVFRDLVRSISRRADSEVPVHFVGTVGQRVLDPAPWHVELPEAALDHVVVIDDSWVTGAHAQSVAAELKSAGVAQVSIFTVARVLRPDWGPNGAFIATRMRSPFDWRRCPWTGEDCPPVSE